MAIIGIYKASVSTQEGPVPELNDPDAEADFSDPQGGAKVVKYVEVKENTNFFIHFKLDQGFKFGQGEYICVHFCVDGTPIQSPVISASEYERDGGAYESSRTGVYETSGSIWQIRKFRFGQLSTNDNSPLDRGEEALAKYAALGEIKVEFWKRKGGPEPTQALKAPHLDTREVSEKLLKGRAVDLSTRLDQGVPAPHPNLFNGVKVGAKLLATFIFKYRSREALKRLGIIERTPTPVPLESRPIEDLNPDELRELVRRQKAEMEAARINIKKERTEARFNDFGELK